MWKTFSTLFVIFILSLNITFADNENIQQYDLIGKKLKDIGIIKARENGDLASKDILKREEAIVVISRMLGKEEEAKNYKISSNFKDVPNDNYYAPYIYWAFDKGITNGKSEDEFGFSEKTTLKMFVTYMLRVLGYEEYAKWGNNDNIVENAKKIGILDDFQIVESENIIRGEVFKIIYNTLYVDVNNDSSEAKNKKNEKLFEKLNLKLEKKKELFNKDDSKNSNVSSNNLNDSDTYDELNREPYVKSILTLSTKEMEICFTRDIKDLKFENLEIYESNKKINDFEIINKDSKDKYILKFKDSFEGKVLQIKIKGVVDANDSSNIMRGLYSNKIKFPVTELFDISLVDKDEIWSGIGPNGEPKNTKVLPYSRIPSVIIDKHGRIIAMFDLRWGEGAQLGNDQARISTGVAISEDGGKTWNKFTAFDSDKTDDNNRRIMDSTMLYDEKNDVIYALHGMWVNGNRQWNGSANQNWENDSWRAVIHKSTDHGYTWEEVTRFSKNDNTNVFENYRFNGDKKILGFLGGVGTGIQTEDGTLVFPIQVTGHGSVNTTILYSKDDGKTWQLPDSENPFMLNGSSEHMVFELDGKLISVGRAVDDITNRHSYYSEDFGKTWKEYEPLNHVIGPERKGRWTGVSAQGSTIKITLPSGNEAVLLTQPKSKRGGNYTRSDITLYVADGRNSKNVAEVVEFYPEVGDPKGAGYSSIYYRDGVLLAAYERQGGIYLKNLSGYIPEIEKIVDSFKESKNNIKLDIVSAEALTKTKIRVKFNKLIKYNNAFKNGIKVSYTKNDKLVEVKVFGADLLEPIDGYSNTIDIWLDNWVGVPANVENVKIEFLPELSLINEEGNLVYTDSINLVDKVAPSITSIWYNRENRSIDNIYLEEFTVLEDQTGKGTITIYTDENIVDSFKPNSLKINDLTANEYIFEVEQSKILLKFKLDKENTKVFSTKLYQLYKLNLNEKLEYSDIGYTLNLSDDFVLKDINNNENNNYKNKNIKIYIKDKDLNKFNIDENLDVKLTNRDSNWEGIGPNGEAENTKVLPYARIPSVIIDKHGRIIAMFDLRWGEGAQLGNDQARISTGVAISEDGGKTWNKFTAFDSDKTDDNNRRIMDSTMLYDEKNDVIYALHGMWVNGNRQWDGFANENWENDSWRAVIHKSTDHGYTWEEVTRFSKKDNISIFENYRFNGDKKILGFLGGVGTGIQTEDGTLVFPIQVTGHKSVNTTILYSKDDGKTWQLPDSENPFIINGSSEHMVFEFDGKLISVGRGVSHDVNRHSYYSEDFGKTWKEYEPLNYVIGPEGKGKIGGAGAQGAALSIILPSGNEAVLLTQPKSKRGPGWTRSDITLYVADGRNSKNVAEVVEFYPEIGDPKGAGYSSIYYRDGVLLVAYERQGDIYLKNLTSYIDKIEEIVSNWGISNYSFYEPSLVNIENLEAISNNTINLTLDREVEVSNCDVNDLEISKYTVKEFSPINLNGDNKTKEFKIILNEDLSDDFNNVYISIKETENITDDYNPIFTNKVQVKNKIKLDVIDDALITDIEVINSEKEIETLNTKFIVDVPFNKNLKSTTYFDLNNLINLNGISGNIINVNVLENKLQISILLDKDFSKKLYSSIKDNDVEFIDIELVFKEGFILSDLNGNIFDNHNIKIHTTDEINNKFISQYDDEINKVSESDSEDIITNEEKTIASEENIDSDIRNDNIAEELEEVVASGEKLEETVISEEIVESEKSLDEKSEIEMNTDITEENEKLEEN